MIVTDEKNVPAMTETAATDVPKPDAREPESSANRSGNSTHATTPPARHSGSSNWGVWLVLLLLIAGIIYGAWYFAQQYMVQQQLLENVQAQLQQQQRATQMQQDTLAATVEQRLEDQQNDVQQAMNELAQRVDNTAARVLALSSVNRDDWKIAEAEYLLRLANQRVLLERNSGNAVALAQSVDEILRDLNDPDLFPVRKALASEMSELTLAGDIDREGVYLRLLALSEQIEKLPLIEPLGSTEEIWPEDEPQENDSLWVKTKRGFMNVLKKFSHHLRVRDHAQPVPAILAPDNQIYLKQNMRLMLEQAQAALLREEAQVYQSSLQKAQEWLKTYFPLNTQSVAAQAELADLQNVIITQSLPNFAESTALLKAYIERKHTKAVSRRGGK
ncbi:MAG TPA: uroporphyrinogen-III C-methyltransferase [Cellvibrio sp.]|nr:uroporphyrinogen-III C-methyltransferase [Cellvibrio sp.]